MADMTLQQYDVLRHAVTLARNENIGRVAVLRQRLVAQGYPEADVKVALEEWARYAEQHR